MFRRIDGTPAAQAPIAWVFNGRACTAWPGESVAAALLRLNVAFIRHHPVDASPRLPFCMMGQCQECLVRMDDGSVQRACMLPVRDGMQVWPAGEADTSS